MNGLLVEGFDKLESFTLRGSDLIQNFKEIQSLEICRGAVDQVDRALFGIGLKSKGFPDGCGIQLGW